MMVAKNAIGSTAAMSSSLNGAAFGISSSTGIMGDVISGAISTVGGNQVALTQYTDPSGNKTLGAVAEIGPLAVRMTTSRSAKPTPLEGFVGLVTKQNAKGSTMAIDI